MHPNDASGDREAKPGSALPLGCRIVRLLELFENLALIRPSDSRPSVTDGNCEGSVFRGRVDPDLALVGKLDGIADEVEQDLRKPTPVAMTYW